ncbi:hypothetical protein Bca52824_012364 [Brassica carinata]|uniref:Uncharacterized protein n=1 Tax=Brassica carinata TaxID=52824 RepID=A0A8X7VXA6_BRACI|nr:hypothetical protein Bca52824_012364 [Brassica carinata]
MIYIKPEIENQVSTCGNSLGTSLDPCLQNTQTLTSTWLNISPSSSAAVLTIGIETVIYKEIPPPECLKTGLDFLKKRKAQVPRSSSILKNSGQALRLVTGAASAKKQPQPQRK